MTYLLGTTQRLDDNVGGRRLVSLDFALLYKIGMLMPWQYSMIAGNALASPRIPKFVPADVYARTNFQLHLGVLR